MKVPSARKLKSGNWNIQLRLNGKSYSITAPTKKECSDKAMLLKAHYANGVTPNNYKAIPTLYDAMTFYINDKGNILSPSTVNGYITIRNTRFKKYSDMRIDASQKQFQKMVNDEALLCAAKTLKNAWGFAKTAMEYCGVSVPPISLPQVVPNEQSFLSAEEIRKLLKIIKGDKYEMLYLFCLHGLRRSEVLALSKSKIVDDIILIRGAKVRNSKGELQYKETNKNSTSRRDVPIMIPRLSELIENFDGDSFFFNFEPDLARKHLNTICKKNNLTRVGLHGLRHSFASLCAVTLQIPDKEILQLGGWSNDQVLKKIYLHVADEEKKSAAEKIRNFFV